MSLLQPSGSQDAVALRQNRLTGAAQDLENTIARFQAILTDDDRIRLQKLKAAQYDTQSIINFTAELDRLDLNRRGKSVASRLASLLQTIQQFTPVVDTYISSNPDLAAIIWGSMRLTFQLLANFTSYFESFVELLSGFGALGSRFSEYQLIFTRSKGLRDSIFKFHTAVILCCEKIVTIVRRPLKSQAWKGLTDSFQSEIRRHVDDIKSKAEDVGQEIQLAKAQSNHYEQQLQAEERKEAAASRSRLFTWFSKSSAEIRQLEEQEKQRAKEQRRHRLLKNLSSYNHNSAFNNTRCKRHLGTAEWILDTTEFKEWHGSEESAVLHITGKIGSGKTVLASHVVEHLFQNREPSQFVSFFFSRFDDIASLKCDTIIRSLIYQALWSVPMNTISLSLASEFMSCLEEVKTQMLPMEMLERLYLKASVLFKDWFIVLDGVDECDPSEQHQLYQFLSRCLQNTHKSHKTKILFSSRETTQTSINRSFASVTRLITGSNQTNSDIRVYAEDVLQSKLSSKQLMVGDSKIVDDIVDSIASKEQGMFLWVYLTIEDLCSRKSDKEIRQALQALPTDLPATFNRALGRIVRQHHQNTAKAVFKLVAGVRRPLTLLELQEALSLEVGQSSLKADDLINGVERVTVWCENLIHVEEMDNTVRFGHHSIREFLLGPETGRFGEFHFELEDADHHVFELCITYVNLDNFKTALETVGQEPSANLQIPIGVIEGHTLQTAVRGSIGARMRQWANLKMKSTIPPSSQDSVSVSSLSTRPNSFSFSTEHPFWGYAADNWYLHKTDINGKVGSKAWDLLGRIFKDPHPALSLPWMDVTWREMITRRFNTSSAESFFDMPVGRLKSSLRRSMSKNCGRIDLRANMIFAVVFGHDKNCILGCRALMVLAEEYPNTDVLGNMVYFSTTIAGHLCPNNSLRTLVQYMDHRRLVNTLTECVADGAEFWPASSDYPESCVCPERGVGVHVDICSLIVRGYRALEHPSLRIFALVSLGRDPNLTLESIFSAAGAEITTVCHSRTALGKSIVEIAAESGSGLSLIRDCFTYPVVKYNARKLWPESHQREHIIEEGLCAAMGCGLPWTTMVLIQSLSKIRQDRVSFIHDGVLIKAFRFYWPPRVASRVVTLLSPPLEKDDLPYLKKLLGLAVECENWPFAELLRMRMGAKMEDWDPINNPKLEFIVSTEVGNIVGRTWECERCSRTVRKRIQVQDRDSFLLAGEKECPVLFEDVVFTFCPHHKKQARTVLNRPGVAKEIFDQEQRENPTTEDKVSFFLLQGIDGVRQCSRGIKMDSKD